MTSFLQKFDQLPKLSLGGELGGASINGKFAELTAPTRKRDLYLITFHPCHSVSEYLLSCIEGALRRSYTKRAVFQPLRSPSE
jgi:hypothetical protein